jgi:hypothetical protein
MLCFFLLGLQDWCLRKGYADQCVNEGRMLVFLQELERRPLNQRGRKSSNSFQLKTTRKMNGKSVVIERRDKNGMVTFRHAAYDKIMNIVETKTLSHHSMKVYVNALVHLYFWQSV